MPDMGPKFRAKPLTFPLLEPSYSAAIGHSQEGKPVSTDVDTTALRPTTLSITGMTCGGCASAVERILSRVPGVMSATVDRDLGVAIVNGSAAPEALISAVSAAGYGAAATDGSAQKGERDERQRRGCC